MLKIVATYVCLTIFLVSVKGNDPISVVTTAAPSKGVQVIDPKIGVNKEPTDEPPITTQSPDNTTTNTPKTTTVNPNTTASTVIPPRTTPYTTTTSTTTQSPNSTPSPTPPPAPKTGEWIVNGTKGICVVVKMAVQFNVSYTTITNKTTWQQLTMPSEKNSTITTGTCNDTEQILNILWHDGEDSLMIHFTKNDTTQKYFMHHIQVSLGTHEFPDIKPNTSVQLIHEAQQFPTNVKNSYKCMRLQKLDLSENGSKNSTGWLKISDLQFQAFKSDNTTSFGLAQDCAAEVSDLVPIAVGCALTILVIIVLVAYLIGRRRSQARGYLSM